MGVNSCGFVGFHNGTVVSGGSKVVRERISVHRVSLTAMLSTDNSGTCLVALFRAVGSKE
jgi:hypothetical protein